LILPEAEDDAFFELQSQISAQSADTRSVSIVRKSTLTSNSRINNNSSH